MKALSAVDLTSPKLPPQNVEAEQSVLGAILLDNTAMAKAMEILTDEEFYRTAHRKIYQAMLELSDRGEVIDQITLTESLKGRSELDAVGGSAYLAELVQAVPTAANIRYHSKIVRDKALLRGLIQTSTEVITRGYDGTAAVDELLDFAEPQSIITIGEEYSDWGLGASYSWNHLTFGLNYVDTDGRFVTPSGRNASKAGLVGSLSVSF